MDTYYLGMSCSSPLVTQHELTTGHVAVNIVYNDFKDADDLAIFKPFSALSEIRVNGVVHA